MMKIATMIIAVEPELEDDTYMLWEIDPRDIPVEAQDASNSKPTKRSRIKFYFSCQTKKIT